MAAEVVAIGGDDATGSLTARGPIVTLGIDDPDTAVVVAPRRTLGRGAPRPPARRGARNGGRRDLALGGARSRSPDDRLVPGRWRLGGHRRADRRDREVPRRRGRPSPAGVRPNVVRRAGRHRHPRPRPRPAVARCRDRRPGDRRPQPRRAACAGPHRRRGPTTADCATPSRRPSTITPTPVATADRRPVVPTSPEDAPTGAAHRRGRHRRLRGLLGRRRARPGAPESDGRADRARRPVAPSRSRRPPTTPSTSCPG